MLDAIERKLLFHLEGNYHFIHHFYLDKYSFDTFLTFYKFCYIQNSKNSKRILLYLCYILTFDRMLVVGFLTGYHTCVLG